MKKLINKKAEILKNFKCQNTGHCCKRPGYVYVTDPEISKMAQELKMTVGTFRQQFVKRDNGWSVIATPDFRVGCFLDKKNCCEIYKARPKECKTYPDWPEIWESDETLLNEAKECKGLAAALVTLSE